MDPNVSSVPDFIVQIIRYVLIAVGGWLAGKGLSPELWAQISGVLLAGLTMLWGIYVKSGTKAVPIATAARTDVPTINPVTGSTVK